jgi:SAM-dependent methyltransferase
MTSYDTALDFGRLYDAIPAYAERPDVAFYVEEAAHAGAGSRVVELGCGTGRITLPLARAGHTVVGVDSSQAMLAECRAKLAREPVEVRERVTLLQGDVRHVAGLETADLVIAPFRVLQHLIHVDDQLACLASVRKMLGRSGRFVFDVFNPSFTSMTRDRSVEVEDTPERPLPDGRTLRRTVRVLGTRWIDQVNEIELIYHVRAGESVERVVQSFEMRWYMATELEHLLARAGFRLEARHGSFARAPLTDDAPEIVIVASLGE